MRVIPAAKFKAECLAILDRVDPEGVIITKHGRPVAKLTPIGAEPAALIGSLKGRIRIRGNILSTGVAWDAQSRHARPAVRSRR
jgi:prevent-host-death family protein